MIFRKWWRWKKPGISPNLVNRPNKISNISHNELAFKKKSAKAICSIWVTGFSQSTTGAKGGCCHFKSLVKDSRVEGIVLQEPAFLPTAKVYAVGGIIWKIGRPDHPRFSSLVNAALKTKEFQNLVQWAQFPVLYSWQKLFWGFSVYRTLKLPRVGIESLNFDGGDIFQYQIQSIGQQV